VTYADIALAHIIGVLEGLGPQIGALLAQYPLVSKLKDVIYNLDGIKQWLANRPDNAF
jgi:hypothetical protein